MKKKYFYCKDDRALSRLHKEAEFILGSIPDFTGFGPQQAALDDPALIKDVRLAGLQQTLPASTTLRFKDIY